jgi:hypothetical protein
LILEGHEIRDLIRQFEKMLLENNVIILKFYLHISKEEQKKRFLTDCRIQKSDGMRTIMKSEKNGINICLLTLMQLTIVA